MVGRLKLLYTHDPDILLALYGGGIATMIAAVLNFLNVYVFADKEFLISLIVLMCVDSVQKMRQILKTDKGKKPEDKEFSTKTFFNKIKDKCINYAALLITVHVLVHFKVNGETVRALSWIDVSIYTCLIAYEGSSIIRNSGKDVKKLLPKGLLDKLSNTSNIETPKKDEEPPTPPQQ